MMSRKRRRASRPRPAVGSPPTKRATGRRAQNKEATRRRIVTAALWLFQAKGFDRTTTKEIARKAAIAEGTVFNYFPTKEDIALYFFAMEVDHAIAAVRADTRLRKAPLEEKLFALIQNQLDYLAPYERFIGAALVLALQPASKLGPFSGPMQDLQTRYLAFVEELIAQSTPKSRRSSFTMWAPLAFWIFYLGVILYWLHDRSVGKQHTLAFLDRSLTIGVRLLIRGR
jgi:AcrR family transcriptional regulator